jgi:hypothetical protein
MKVTLDLPDEWASCLPKRKEELAEIVTAGLHRRRNRERHEIHSLADIMETLAELPSARQVLALRPSKVLSARIEVLLDRKREAKLTPDESAEWEQIMRAEHLIRIAKAKAARKLKQPRWGCKLNRVNGQTRGQ